MVVVVGQPRAKREEENVGAIIRIRIADLRCIHLLACKLRQLVASLELASGLGW